MVEKGVISYKNSLGKLEKRYFAPFPHQFDFYVKAVSTKTKTTICRHFEIEDIKHLP